MIWIGSNRVDRLNPHVIPDVDPAKMEGVNIGDTIIITYSQAVALSLEKAPTK